MRKSHALTLAAGVLALAVVALAVAATQQSVRGVARFRETSVTHIRSGVAEAWRTRVWLPREQQTVGTGVLACMRVDAYTDIRECSGTYILPRGRIQLAGEIITRAAYQLTIVGGSGIYISTGGVAVFERLKDVTSIVFYLQ